MPTTEDDFRTGGAFDLLGAGQERADAAMLGRVVAAYRLTELVGTGGMGAVFRAEPLSEHLDRDVAVKLLARGLRPPESRGEFLAEARIQSRLAHPSIAHLYDAGISDDGWPFLVMELVDGERVDHYCDAQDLPRRERVALVRQIVEAVSYAHANLVLHGDIKPGNVLVDRNGLPRLLDFGIARLLGAEGDGEQAVATGVMTPAYASPEQVLGEPVTTASDVFQLGALLWAVLTGASPFEGHSAADAIARAERWSPGDLPGAPALPRELRAVIERCLEPDPSERYRNAGALAADLDRYLAGHPVAARRHGWPSRAGLFLRRNAAASVVAAVLVAVLIGANFAYLHALRDSRNAARTAAAESEAVTEFLIGLFHSSDPDRASGEDLSAREILEAGAQRVDEELEDQPAIRADVLTALGRVFFSLRDLERSEETLESALALQRSLYGDEDPRLAEAHAALGRTLYLRIGAGDESAALEHYGRALDLHAREHGEDLRYAELLGEAAVIEMGVNEDYAGAVEMLDRARAIQDRELGPEDPRRIFTLVQLLRAHERLGEFERAQAYGERAVQIAEAAFGPLHARVASPLFYLARVLESQGKYAEAAGIFTRVLDINLAVYGPDDERTADTHLNLAHVLRMSGGLEESLPHAERSLTVMRAALGPDHMNTATAASVLARSYQEAGRYAEAEPLFREAVRVYSETLGPDRGATAYGHLVYGDFLADAGRYAEAVEQHGRALDIWMALVGPGEPDSAKVALALGRDRMELGQLEEAESLLLSALRTHEEKLPEDHLRLAETYLALGRLRTLQGRGAECEGPLGRGIAIREARLPAGHGDIALAKALLAECFFLRGEQERGRALLGAAMGALSNMPSAAAARVREQYSGVLDVAVSKGAQER